MFTTDRLNIRAYRDSDLEDMMRLANDVEVQKGVNDTGIVPRDPSYAESMRKAQKDSLMNVVVTLRSTDEFIGTARTWQNGGPKNREALFGLAIAPEYWNKGYGTELTKFMVDYAFRWLGQHRVTLGVLGGNMKAISVYKKLGFRMEVTRRKSNWVDGTWEDAHEMGILENEWAAKHWTEKI